MAIFRFLKLAAAVILDLYFFLNFSCRNAPEVESASSCQISWRLLKNIDCGDMPIFPFGGLYHCAKFGWDRCSSFDNMHVF